MTRNDSLPPPGISGNHQKQKQNKNNWYGKKEKLKQSQLYIQILLKPFG
jgi:hypothetical protein